MFVVSKEAIRARMPKNQFELRNQIKRSILGTHTGLSFEISVCRDYNHFRSENWPLVLVLTENMTRSEIVIGSLDFFIFNCYLV